MDASTAIGLINSGKFNPDQLLIIGKFAKSNSIWKLIVENNGFSEEGLFDIALEVNHPDIWMSVLKKTDFDDETLLQIGETADNGNVWHKILKKLNYDFERLLKLGEEINTQSAWCGIIKTGSLSFEQIYKLASRFDYDEIWRFAIESNKLTSEQLMFICNLVQKLSITIAAVRTRKLSSKEMFALAERISDIKLAGQHYEFWQVVIETGLLNSAEILNIIFNKAFRSEDFLSFISNEIDFSRLKQDDLYVIAKHTKNFSLLNLIFKTGKLSFAQMMSLAENNPALWHMAAYHFDISRYDFELFFALCKEVDNIIFWKVAFEQADKDKFSMEHLMRFAETFKCSAIWQELFNYLLESNRAEADLLLNIADRIGEPDNYNNIYNAFNELTNEQMLRLIYGMKHYTLIGDIVKIKLDWAGFKGDCTTLW